MPFECRFTYVFQTVPSAPSNAPPSHTTSPNVPYPFPPSTTRGATEDSLFGSRSTPNTFHAPIPDPAIPPPASKAGRAADSGPSSSVPPPRPTVNNSTQYGHGPFRAHGMKREERMTDIGEDLGGRDGQGSTGKHTFNPADKVSRSSILYAFRATKTAHGRPIVLHRSSTRTAVVNASVVSHQPIRPPARRGRHPRRILNHSLRLPHPRRRQPMQSDKWSISGSSFFHRRPPSTARSTSVRTLPSM